MAWRRGGWRVLTWNADSMTSEKSLDDKGENARGLMWKDEVSRDTTTFQGDDCARSVLEFEKVDDISFAAL